jgi:hypothetical protein
MKKFAVFLSSSLLIAGLAILLFDAYTSRKYGFHMNDVAGVTDDGQAIDWPTGERPSFTLIPLAAYALGFCIMAGLIYWFGSFLRRAPQERVVRETE